VAPPAREQTLGAAAVADVQSGAWAPGVRLEVARGSAGARWRARLALAGVGRHQIDLQPGRVSWWRAFVQLGADVAVVRGRHWAGVLGAGVLGGVVSIAGAASRSTGRPAASTWGAKRARASSFSLVKKAGSGPG